MPGDLNELSIRHHHFSESDAKFYDGVVRVQSLDKSMYIKTPTIIKSDTTQTTSNPTTKLAATTPATVTGTLNHIICHYFVFCSNCHSQIDSIVMI